MVKVSVIVPVYNGEKTLGTCIDSIIHQSLHDIEIILVDDGSTDKSGGICDDYSEADNRIKVFHHQVNSGVTKARQTGIFHSTGDYITFVDADDSISCNFIKQLYENAGSYKFIYGSNYHTTTVEVSRFNFIKGLLYAGYVWALCGKLYHRSLFNESIMNTPRCINIGEDLVENIKIVRQVETVLFVPSNGYQYTINPDSVTHTRTWTLAYEEAFVDEVEKAFGQDEPDYREILWVFKVHTWKHLVLHNVKVNRNMKWIQSLLNNRPQDASIGLGDKVILHIKNHYLAMIFLKIIDYLKK